MAESKATALLGPVPSLTNEFNRCVENLKALLSKVVPYVDQSGMMVQENGRTLIKVTHEMFMLREGASASDLTPHALSEADEHDSEGNGPLDTEVMPAFRMQNWPVQDNCIRLCDAMVKTYRVNPLPAFMDGSAHPIVPTNYTNCLRGAIVRIYFTLSHKILRRKIPSSFFTATVDEIVVLQVHMPADLSPSRARLAARFLMNSPQEIAEPKDKDEKAEAGNSGRVKRRRL
ncbi:hypothetical protein FRC08_018222 [Ceratobasidium sp. 394]|nr:hypothetical protein FRC08_018222 [Ceratobasidium sp. 394]